MSIKLGVNVDHIATIREARKGKEPDPVAAAMIAELAGCNGITAHLREDKRHIQDRDIRLLRGTVTTKLNLEMAPTQAMVQFAINRQPDMVTLVPEIHGTKFAGASSQGTFNPVRRRALFPHDSCLHTEMLLPTRGVAASGFPPLCNIPYCCLP